jgi:tetratricopeptide (TPR) repeat protein
MLRSTELRLSPRLVTPAAAAQELRLCRALLERAETDARAALALAPRSGLARYVVARVREQLDAPPSEIIAVAQAALETLPSTDVERRALVLFSLGVAYTRLERHAHARDAYALIVSDAAAPARPTALCNLAEVHMYLGEVDASIDRYRECARAMPTTATAWWGLAVAHDRAGHEGDSRVAADRAASMDPELRDITGEGVFYVPAYERHYYIAIAREALARQQSGERPLIAALAAWRAYVQEGGPTAPWLDRARAHIATLERSLSTLARADVGASRVARPARRPTATIR